MAATEGTEAGGSGGARTHLDELLEEALLGSFPASDPPAIDVAPRPPASGRPVGGNG